MSCPRRWFIALGTCFVLIGCQASVTGPQAVDLPLLDVRFTYPFAPTIREQNGEYLLHAHGANIFANRFPYHQKSTAIDDWTVTPAIRDKILANPDCDILKDARVYLPVNTRKTMHCSVLSVDASAVIVAATGYGIPDASLDFLQSMILVLRPSDFVLITGLTPFPVADAAVQKMTDDYPVTHPELPAPVWPNRGFHFLAIDVRDYLESQLSPPSEEVAANNALLLNMAGSMSLTDGAR